MKSVVADYQTRIFAVRIEAIDGVNISRFVQYPHPLTMVSNDSPVSTVEYLTATANEFSNISMNATMTPPVVDFQGIVSSAIGELSRTDVAARVWDNAKAYLFATSWANPVEDEEPLGKFLMGRSKIEDDRYILEFMGLIDAVNQSTGSNIEPICRWTLFDETLDGVTVPWVRSRCTGPRASSDGPALASYKVTGTVTGVTDKSTFRDSARTEVDDYFGAGSIRFTSGNNNGLLSEEVKSYVGVTSPLTAAGTVATFQPFPYEIQVGDTYEMVPGCRGRRTEDCIAKFSNGINHGGFDRVPTQSVYGKFGTGDA